MAQPSYPKPIVLVGLMGSGKTTVGRALAETIGYLFVDNDAGIEAEYDASGRELAERLGVEELHRIEASQLEHALTLFGSEGVVIAAAASAVDDEASRALLGAHAVVWLQAEPAYLAERMQGGNHRRHLGLDRTGALTAQAEARREHLASVSDLAVWVEGRSVHDIVEEICTGIGALPSDNPDR